MSESRCLNIGTEHHVDGEVTLVLAGKCNGGSLGELRRAIDKARRMQQNIVIDMSEVTLVDRPSLQFLAAQAREDVRLVNCPEYIQPWIFRETSQ